MKALLIAPVFFGYEKVIYSALEERGFAVDFMDSEQLKPEYWQCWNKDFIHKVRRHVLPNQREKDRKRADIIFTEKYLECYLKEMDLDKNAYSLVIVVKGDVIQDAVYEIIRKNNPKARFILYLWDDVDPLHRKDYFHYFDKIFSYNIQDCERFGWTYLPVFIQKVCGVDLKQKREYDIAIIGSAHKERIKTAKKI